MALGSLKCFQTNSGCNFRVHGLRHYDSEMEHKIMPVFIAGVT